MRLRVCAAFAAAVLLAGCEGWFGGEEAARIPLQPAAGGGFEPVRILLRPQMNAVAFDLNAEFAWGRREDAGGHDRYRAILSTRGRTVETAEFTVNSPGQGDAARDSSSPPNSLRQLLLVADLRSEGEYELVIVPLQPPVVTLDAAQLVVRINVPPAGRP
ncbi:MAG: hypothetical protein KF771_01710 [Burkholderiales bacterium]|nr:hypothetical protein [Burkholderiales bacterium]